MTEPIDKRLKKLNSTSLIYLKKAQMVLESKMNRQDIAKETGISYATIRTMVTRPERLNSTSWLNVMLLAEYYDRILPRLDKGAKPDLRTSDVIVNGRLFSDPKYQGMTTAAKLIYSYLTLPSQKRYKDENGKEFVICHMADLERLTNHTRPTIRKALMELQDHGLLANCENKTLPQPQRYYVIPITETEE